MVTVATTPVVTTPVFFICFRHEFRVIDHTELHAAMAHIPTKYHCMERPGTTRNDPERPGTT